MTQKIRAIILNLLTRRDHSILELTQKLRIKGHVTEEITAVIADLVQIGLINESRFAENYIRWRTMKGYGPMRISQELQIRGIASEMIADQLDITDNAWLTTVRKCWQKHFKSRIPTDFKQRAKQMRFLQYRGFTREQIASVFSQIAEFDE